MMKKKVESERVQEYEESVGQHCPNEGTVELLSGTEFPHGRKICAACREYNGGDNKNRECYKAKLVKQISFDNPKNKHKKEAEPMFSL